MENYKQTSSGYNPFSYVMGNSRDPGKTHHKASSVCSTSLQNVFVLGNSQAVSLVLTNCIWIFLPRVLKDCAKFRGVELAA